MLRYFRILGTAGTYPTKYRNVTSTYVKIIETRFIIDCGEGTQKQMAKFEESTDIDFILFTHNHADHINGLWGFLETLTLFGRTRPLFIYGNKEIAYIQKIFRAFNKKYSYEIFFNILDTNDTLDFKTFTIRPIKLNHSTLCFGYLITVPFKAKLDNEKILQQGLKSGEWCKEIVEKGSVNLNNVQYFLEQFIKEQPSKYTVFIGADTRPIEYKFTADVFIHEATYADEQFKEAIKNKHSTISEAVEVLNKHKTKIATHFSQRIHSSINEYKLKYPGIVFAIDGFLKEICLENKQ